MLLSKEDFRGSHGKSERVERYERNEGEQISREEEELLKVSI